MRILLSLLCAFTTVLKAWKLVRLALTFDNRATAPVFTVSVHVVNRKFYVRRFNNRTFARQVIETTIKYENRNRVSVRKHGRQHAIESYPTADGGVGRSYCRPHRHETRPFVTAGRSRHCHIRHCRHCWPEPSLSYSSLASLLPELSLSHSSLASLLLKLSLQPLPEPVQLLAATVCAIVASLPS